ncbi:MAG: hypothetical protein WCT07_03970 [Candidatus Paceibacterota bacterium]
MNFDKFLNFNSRCPICGEPLTLYFQLLDSICFRGIPILGSSNRSYRFEQFKCIESEFNGEYIDIDFMESGTTVRFSSDKMKDKCLEHQSFFFFLCNEDGFKEKSGYSSQYYEIYLYYGCYHRASVVLNVSKTESGDFIIKPTLKKSSKLINSDESFCLKRKIDDLEKIYILSISYEEKNTMLWYYTCNDEQAKDEKYTPNIFEKKLPLLKRRPNFDLEDRDKLFSRLDNWILMS